MLALRSWQDLWELWRCPQCKVCQTESPRLTIRDNHAILCCALDFSRLERMLGLFFSALLLSKSAFSFLCPLRFASCAAKVMTLLALSSAKPATVVSTRSAWTGRRFRRKSLLFDPRPPKLNTHNLRKCHCFFSTRVARNQKKNSNVIPCARRFIIKRHSF